MKNWMNEISENDRIAALGQDFPGKCCGNSECEQQCATALQIAKMGNLPVRNFITDIIRQEIASKSKCLPYKPDFPKDRFTVPCRFGFVKPDLTLKKFEDKGKIIVGKKYISDMDTSKTGVCKKCQENANRVFKWPEESHLMPKLPIHPNCKCRYENVYEKEKREVYDKYVLQRVRAETLKYARSRIGKYYGKLKCNSFIMEIFNVPNGRVITGPISERYKIIHRNPSAKEFYYGEVEGFKRVFDPQPGDICVDMGTGRVGGHGHVGIVSGYKRTISASSVTGTVVENDWGFRKEENKNARFYRYVGDKRFPPL